MSTPPDPPPPSDPGTPPPAIDARRKERAPYLPLCIVLAGLVLLLMRQNLALRGQIRSLLPRRSPEALHAGQASRPVPDFRPAETNGPPPTAASTR